MVVGSTEVYLPLEGLVDLAAERARLARELAEHERLIQKSESLLASGFAEKAPPAVVEKERAKLGSLQDAREKLSGRLQEIT
jgi:valyl-tRNA synthetase